MRAFIVQLINKTTIETVRIIIVREKLQKDVKVIDIFLIFIDAIDGIINET